MAWLDANTASRFYGASSGDLLQALALGATTAVKSIDVSASYYNTGPYGYVAHYDIPGGDCSLDLGRPMHMDASGAVYVLRGYFGVSASPTSGLGVLGAGARGSQSYLRVLPDRTLQVFDKTGVARTPATVTAIPTGGALQEVTVVIDCITLSTVWIAIAMGTAWEVAYDTGLGRSAMFDEAAVLCLGEYLATGVSRSADLYFDDVSWRFTSSAADAPHLVAYPRTKVNGCNLPTSVGSYNAWTIGGTSPPANKWEACDDVPNNGETDFIQTAVADDKQTFHYGGSNPIPVGGTIIRGQMCWDQRVVGASKQGAYGVLRLAGADATVSSLVNPPAGAWYAVGQNRVDRPGGGAWARADVAPGTLEIGVGGYGILGTPTVQATLLCAPEWLYYTDSLGLSPEPQVGVTVQAVPSQVKGGRGPLVRPAYDHIDRRTLRGVREVAESVRRTVRS